MLQQRTLPAIQPQTSPQRVRCNHSFQTLHRVLQKRGGAKDLRQGERRRRRASPRLASPGRPQLPGTVVPERRLALHCTPLARPVSVAAVCSRSAAMHTATPAPFPQRSQPQRTLRCRGSPLLHHPLQVQGRRPELRPDAGVPQLHLLPPNNSGGKRCLAHWRRLSGESAYHRRRRRCRSLSREREWFVNHRPLRHVFVSGKSSFPRLPPPCQVRPSNRRLGRSLGRSNAWEPTQPQQG